MSDPTTEAVRHNRIMIGAADVTDHVAALYDALVASMDWGSGFLDVETIEAALILADLAGFQSVTVSKIRLPGPPQLITAWREQVAAKARALAADAAAAMTDDEPVVSDVNDRVLTLVGLGMQAADEVQLSDIPRIAKECQRRREAFRVMLLEEDDLMTFTEGDDAARMFPSAWQAVNRILDALRKAGG